MYLSGNATTAVLVAIICLTMLGIALAAILASRASNRDAVAARNAQNLADANRLAAVQAATTVIGGLQGQGNLRAVQVNPNGSWNADIRPTPVNPINGVQEYVYEADGSGHQRMFIPAPPAPNYQPVVQQYYCIVPPHAQVAGFAPVHAQPAALPPGPAPAPAAAAVP